MKPKIAVFGSGDQGLAMTADLILAGYEVNLLELPELQHGIKEIKKNDGIYLNGKENLELIQKHYATRQNFNTVCISAKKNENLGEFKEILGEHVRKRHYMIYPNYLKNEHY